MEIFHSHLLVRIVAAILVADEYHHARDPLVGENRGVVPGAAGESLVRDSETRGMGGEGVVERATQDRWRAAGALAEREAHTALRLDRCDEIVKVVFDPRQHRHVLAAYVEAEADLARGFRKSVHRWISEELADRNRCPLAFRFDLGP